MQRSCCLTLFFALLPHPAPTPPAHITPWRPPPSRSPPAPLSRCQPPPPPRPPACWPCSPSPTRHCPRLPCAASTRASPPFGLRSRPRSPWSRPRRTTRALSTGSWRRWWRARYGREREREERGGEKRAPLASNARHRNARDLALTAPAPLLFFQVFYHLGELDDALTYALAAGTLFDVNDAGDFTQAVLGERRRGETGGRSAGQTERPHPAAFVWGQAWPIAPPGRPGLDGLHLCAM